MSSQDSNSEKGLRDQRRKRILWEIGAWEEPVTPIHEDSFWGRRAPLYGLALHIAVFILGRLLLEFAWGFNISIEKAAVIFLWIVILAEHWMQTSRGIGRYVFGSLRLESRYNREQDGSRKKQSLREDFDLDHTLRQVYRFMTFTQVASLLVSLLVFSVFYPDITLKHFAVHFVASTGSVVLGIGFHWITVYIRPDLRNAILKSKSEYANAESAAELPNPGAQYALSDDGELLEVEAAEDRRKR